VLREDTRLVGTSEPGGGAWRIAVLGPRLTVPGPIPKIMPLLIDAWGRQQREVQLVPWGRRTEGEALPAKAIGRVRDVLHARSVVVRGAFPVVLINTSHDWLTLIRDVALLSTLRRRDCVLVVHIHGSNTPRLLGRGSRPFKWVTQALLRLSDAVLVLSQQEKADWTAFSPASRVFVVKNPLTEPIEPSTRARAAEEPATILTVARLIPGKGGIDLVRALPDVQRTVRCRLVLAGSGPEKERLEALAAEVDVAESVVFAGYVEGADLAALYQQADVFALPTSLTEGFPTAILEAMAAGLPIVTTPSRGPVDHLVPGQHALFVEPGDGVALADELVRVLGDDELRRSMGAANLRKIREFHPDVVAAEYLDVLDEIVATVRRERGIEGPSGG
jgi:glycosyltransferase involved in cell wall biosynthesis